jgi:hypothetical protein
VTELALHIHPEEVAALEEALWSDKETDLNLGLAVLTRIKTRVADTLPPDQAVAWMRIVMAPLGLRAARIACEMHETRIAQLNAQMEDKPPAADAKLQALANRALLERIESLETRLAAGGVSA